MRVRGVEDSGIQGKNYVYKQLEGNRKNMKLPNRKNVRILNFQLSTSYSLRGGFTLIEIMVVVFIIGILLALVAPKLIGRTDDARVVEAKAQIKNFDTALKLYKMDTGFYPSTEQGLEALISKPSTGELPQNYREGGYLEKRNIPADPWGNPYVYISPGLEGDYDIISYGADSRPGGEGYDADITNWDS